MTAQYDLPVEESVAVLAEFKPKFIHHSKSKELICALLGAFGCYLEQTYSTFRGCGPRPPATI